MAAATAGDLMGMSLQPGCKDWLPGTLSNTHSNYPPSFGFSVK